jgi:hypothetical protein
MNLFEFANYQNQNGMKEIYKRKSDGTIREFELLDLTVTYREGKINTILEEIIRKELSDAKEAHSFFYQLRNDKTKGAVAEHGIKDVKKSSWMVTAGEHGQLECVVFRVKEGKILEPVPAEDFFIEEGGEFYHNLKSHLLNGQVSYPREIVLQCLTENLSGLTLNINKGISSLVADVQNEFNYYLSAGDDDEENGDDDEAEDEAPYFDLIHLEWSGSATADERNAFAYPYSK